MSTGNKFNVGFDDEEIPMPLNNPSDFQIQKAEIQQPELKQEKIISEKIEVKAENKEEKAEEISEWDKVIQVENENLNKPEEVSPEIKLIPEDLLKKPLNNESIENNHKENEHLKEDFHQNNTSHNSEENSSYRGRGRGSRRGSNSRRGYFSNNNNSSGRPYYNKYKELKEKLSERYPGIGKFELENILAITKPILQEFRSKVLDNLCYSQELYEKTLTKELLPEGEPIENAYKFELELYADYLSKYKILQCSGPCRLKSKCLKWHSKTEKRRKPLVYENGAWNYYPILCKDPRECPGESCIFSHNYYEFEYHPLLYKATMCGYNVDSDGLTCQNLGEKCPKAHSLKDLRNIEWFCEKIKSNAAILKKFIKNDSEINESSENSIQISENITKIETPKPENVNPYNDNSIIKQFKTLPCENPNCSNIYQCEKYHNSYEKRRQYGFFKYCAEICENVYKNGKFLDPGLCENGEECKFCHTKNEWYYHPENYKKKECHRSKCPYGKFCPDIHKTLNCAEISNADYENMKKEYENLKIKLHKLEKIKAKSMNYKCQKCDKIMENAFWYNSECKHKFCEDCIKNQENSCILCQEVLNEKIIKINLL